MAKRRLRRDLPRLLLAATLLWALPLRAASDSPFSGYFLVYDYLDLTRALDEARFTAQEHPGAKWFSTDRGGLRFQLRVNQSFTPDVLLDAALNVDYNVAAATRSPTSDLSDGMRLVFKEGYISWGRVFPWLDLKLGRQYVFWGRFEWGSVEDVVAPWDFANMGAEKENFRLAVDAVRAFATFSPVTLEALVLPWTVPSRMPFRMPATLGPMTVVQEPAVVPPTTAENVETGARVALSLDGGEVGLAWFRGYDRTFSLYAEVQNDPSTGWPTALHFTPRYERQQMLAADFEAEAGPILLLGEVGMFFTPDRAGDDPFVKNWQLRSVLGFEWDATSAFRVQAQAGYTRLFSYSRQAEYDTRHALGEPDPYVPAADQFAVTYKLQYQVLPELGLHAMNLINIPDSRSADTLVLAFVAWEPLEALKLYAGAIVFRGEAGTRFGRTEDQSRVFFELKHGF